MVVERPHPKLKSVKMTGVPIKLSGTPGEAGDAPPLLGQHTTEVLRDLGYKDADIDRLKKAGAIMMIQLLSCRACRASQPFVRSWQREL